MSDPFTSDPTYVADLSWRDLSAAELNTTAMWLEAAEVVLRALYPNVGARVAAGTLSVATVQHVQVQMVLRVVKNPENLRQWSVDDASFTRDQAVSSGLLVLDPAEAKLLAPPQRRLRYGTIRLGTSL